MCTFELPLFEKAQSFIKQIILCNYFLCLFILFLLNGKSIELIFCLIHGQSIFL